MHTQTDGSMAFGMWLKRRRQALDLTQEALAEHVGCAPSTLQKIEQGVRRPSRAMAERLVAVLDVAPEERPSVLRLARESMPTALSRVKLSAAPAPGHILPPHGVPIPEASGSDLSVPTSEADTLPPAQLPESPSVTPLTLTKILPPPMRRQIVPRPRLTDQLSAEHGGTVTLVVAPAGFGKTTLLVEWLEGLSSEQRGQVAWLALDESDSDVVRLARYLIAALQRCQPSVGRTALEILETPRPSIEPVLTLLINDVTLLERPLMLVLDDYHALRAHSIHQALTFFIEHLPPNLHLVIATREDPPLPLARLRARQQLHEIRASDLRFTEDEVAAFLTGAMGLSIDQEEIAALEQRTEGWAAGLQFAALALRERADRSTFIRSFTGSHRLVLDYLVEEVFARLPHHLRTFLLSTSILDRLCGPLCDAVLGLTSDDRRRASSDRAEYLPRAETTQVRGSPFLGDSYSQLILEEIERAHLFLVPLDGERLWYRYHHLFGAAMRERLWRGAAPAAIAALQERAATWFVGQGLLREAIRYALAGQHWNRAAQLIEQIGGQLLQEGTIDTLSEMIEAIPLPTRSDHPRLLYLLGLCARQRWALETARTLFRQAAEAFSAAADEVGRSESLVYLADCHRMLGAYDEGRRALDQALAGPLPAARRAIAMRSRAYQAGLAGDWQLAMRYLDEALDLLEQSADRQALFELAINLRSIFLALPGASSRAERVCRLIHQAPVGVLSPLQAVDHFLGGFVRLLHGDVAASHTAFVQVMRLADQLGAHAQLSLDVSVCLLRSAALLNDFDMAHQHAERIVSMLQEPTLAAFRQAWGVYYLSARGWLCWLVGLYDEARAIVDEMEALANDDEWPLMTLIRRVLRCLILVADGDFTAAETWLRTAFIDQQQFRDSVLFADAGLLLAYVYLQRDRPADALAILNDVLAMHEHAGTPGLVMLTGPRIVEPLLRLAIAHNVHGHFATRILRALPGAEAHAQGAPVQIPPYES